MLILFFQSKNEENTGLISFPVSIFFDLVGKSPVLFDKNNSECFIFA